MYRERDNRGSGRYDDGYRRSSNRSSSSRRDDGYSSSRRDYRDGGRRRRRYDGDAPRESGIVCSLKSEFGFIKTQDGGDIFFHYSELRGCRDDEIQIGDEVEYSASTDRRSGDKRRAAKVKILRTKEQRREDLLRDAKLERGIVSSVNFRDRSGLIDRVESLSESKLISFSFTDLANKEDEEDKKGQDFRRRGNKTTTREGDSVEYHVVKDGYDEIALNIKILPKGTVTYEEELPVRLSGKISKAYVRVNEKSSSSRGRSRSHNKKAVPNGSIQVPLSEVKKHGWVVSESQILKPDIKNFALDVEDWADDEVEATGVDEDSLIEIPIIANDLSCYILSELSMLREGDLVEASLMLHKQTRKIRAERLVLKELSSSKTRDFGVVVKTVPEKGFGFIRAVKEKEDVYFHFDEIVQFSSSDDENDEDNKERSTLQQLSSSQLCERDEVSFDLDEKRSRGNKQVAFRVLRVPSGTVKFEEIVKRDLEGIVEKEISSRNGKGTIGMEMKDDDEKEYPNKVSFSSHDLGRVSVRSRDRVQFDLARVVRNGKWIAMNVRLLKRAPQYISIETRMVGEVTRNIITQHAEKRPSKNSTKDMTQGHLKLLGPRLKSSEEEEEEKKKPRHKVMFLCNHNSCRSQMAEGWLRHLCNDTVDVASAGIECGTKIREEAKIVMKECDVDISNQKSESMNDFDVNDFDVVISMCGCGAKLDGNDVKKAWKQRSVWEDWNLDDPPKLDTGDYNVYRRVRDECKVKVEALLRSFEKEQEDLHDKNEDVKHPESGKSVLGHSFIFSVSKKKKKKKKKKKNDDVEKEEEEEENEEEEKEEEEKEEEETEEDKNETILKDLRIGDLVEFTARISLTKRKHDAVECKLLRRAPQRIGKVVSLKSAFGFIRTKGMKKKSDEIYFNLTELHKEDSDTAPLRIGDTVRFSEIKAASRKGFIKRAVEVYIEKRGTGEKEPEARPESKRLNILLRKKSSGRLGFNAATRQAKGPDGTNGFLEGWRTRPVVEILEKKKVDVVSPMTPDDDDNIPYYERLEAMMLSSSSTAPSSSVEKE